MTTTTSEHDAHPGDPHLPHALPLGLLVKVFVGLMVLTFLTVAATWIDVGSFNIWIALIIAFVKAVLVGLYFMHLRYDSLFNSIVLVTALFIVMLFIGIALIDSQAYQPAVDAAVPPAAATVAPAQPAH